MATVSQISAETGQGPAHYKTLQFRAGAGGSGYEWHPFSTRYLVEVASRSIPCGIGGGSSAG
jgi:hypothetical protein